MSNHEVEVTRDPSRSHHHQRHASNEDRLQPQDGQRLDDGRDFVEVVGRVGHDEAAA
jgi:hypothetical protein